MHNPLLSIIRGRIEQSGPLSVADYMSLALGHPEHGYYITRDPFGKGGDFITAPEVSQMFGELIGLWAATVWMQMGQPDRVVLAEAGPGRGTLMADALRAAKFVPGFVDAIEIRLIETSPTLRERQAAALPTVTPVWHDDLSSLPEHPTIFIANEFLDALPIHQLVKTENGWQERAVTTDEDGSLTWTQISADAALIDLVSDQVKQTARPDEIAEISPASIDVIKTVSRHIAQSGGAALFIDYGYPLSAPGDTLQALENHKFADVLGNPGNADLTAHVDFDAMARAINGTGATATESRTQAMFLRALGIEQRAEILSQAGDDKSRQKIALDLNRLIGASEMGTLFRAMAIHPEGTPVPAGLE